MHNIYTISNPKDESVFYVGSSSNIKQRFARHINDKSNPEKWAVVYDILNSGLRPKFDIIFKTDDYELAEFVESEYIELYKFRGHILTNRNNGGNRPPSQKGNFYSPERKLKSFEASVLKKKVEQLDKSGNVVNVFNGVREAYRLTGIDHRSISQVAAGSKIRKTAGGFKWRYI